MSSPINLSIEGLIGMTLKYLSPDSSDDDIKILVSDIKASNTLLDYSKFTKKSQKNKNTYESDAYRKDGTKRISTVSNKLFNSISIERDFIFIDMHKGIANITSTLNLDKYKIEIKKLKDNIDGPE